MADTLTWALPSLLVAYLLHSTVLLGAVALLDASGWLRRLGAGEWAWRAALLGAWLSSGVALALVSQPAERAVPVAVSNAPAALALVAPTAAVPVAPPPPPLEAASPAPLAVAKAWALPLSLLWALGGLVGLGALLLQTLLLRWRLGRLPPWPDATLLQRLVALAALQGLPSPQLRRCAHSSSPWAWAQAIVLPAWTADALSAAQREAVLAHELAHLRRRDPLWRWLDQLAARAGWLQPLNRLALRRLDALAEQACDAAAVRATGQAEPLAESLLRCAEHLCGQAPSSLSAAMAARRSPLVARLRLLLEPSTMSTLFSPSRPIRLALLAALLTAAVALPAARLSANDSLLPDWFSGGMDDLREGLAIGSTMTVNGRSSVVRSSGPDGRLHLSWKGRLQLNADETDVLAVEGPLRFLERRGGLLRTWTVTPQRDGSLLREYRVNGQVQALDAEGRAWLQRLLAQAVEVGLSPQQRAERYLARGGVPALLADIDAADSDFARRNRIEGGLAALPAAQRQAPTLLALLARAAQVHSSYERRLVLLSLAAELPASEQPALLRAASNMESDFERAQLLSELAPRLGTDAATQGAWLQVAQTIGSDYERRRAIEAQLRQGQPEWRASLIEASSGMQSDYEQREALQAVLGRLAPTDTLLRLRALAISKDLQSDHEAAALLKAALKPAGQPADVLAAALARSVSVQSGHERLQVLLALAPQLPAELHPAYRAAARDLSTHERGQAEQALDR